AAAGLLVQAREIAPDFASAWFALGDIREQLKDRPGAIAAFRKALQADRGDRHGAGLRLVRLGEAVAGEPMSREYVRALFDQYAPRFEAELVGGLRYCGPQLLRQAVETVAGAGVRFERMLDLGCGTGLAAETFAPLCRTAVGIDLSPAMIEIARRKSLYVDLAAADMTERLGQEPTSSADLVVAADAFVYLADLTPVCREAARVLIPGGLLAFSVETHPDGGVILGDKLRYAHAAGHVSAAMDAASLTIRIRDPASVRHDGGIAVPGLIVVASPARPPHGWGGRGVPRRRG
ncbi:MAG: methyltransferase domain-containing protein, partial [Xanthobacteraceae bacterium]